MPSSRGSSHPGVEPESLSSPTLAGGFFFLFFLFFTTSTTWVQMVKRLPTMWETRVQSLVWEGLLEKEMATHSSILAWRIPRMEEPHRLQSMELQSQLSDFTFTFHLGCP